MNRHHALMFSVMVFASPASAAFALPDALVVPPDSFINQHVASVPQLSDQVTLDPVVRRRLARHFHTSGPAMVRYIQKNLVLKRLTASQRYPVYCITPTGQEYLIHSRLVAGTPVFVLRGTNTPVLKLACGNPMMAALPTVKTSPSLEEAPKLASLPSSGGANIAPTLAPNTPYIVASAAGPGVDIIPAPTVKVSAIPIGVLSHGGGSPLGFLAGLPILYGITHGGSNGNNSGPGTNNTTGPGTGPGNNTTGPGTGPGNNTTGPGTGPGNNTTGPGTGPGNNTTGPGTGPGNNTTSNTGVTPVPEPSSYAAFAVGGLGLAMMVGKARRRVRKANH